MKASASKILIGLFRMVLNSLRIRFLTALSKVIRFFCMRKEGKNKSNKMH